jgi:hypothetical protein
MRMQTVTTSSGGVTTIDVVLPLDDAEATELKCCEEVMERGVGSRRVMGTARYEMGDALRRIRDGRLHRATHSSFNSYCHDRWDIRSGRARHMIKASLVAENVSATVDKPTSESQRRPLALLPPPAEVSPTPRDEAGEQGHTTEASASQLQLHDDEALALEQHEAVIERGINTFIEVGEALLHIRDERLYRATHTTFEEYCRERWNMSRPRAYQLIDAANIAANLSTGVDIAAPTSERQVRPLAPLSPEDQRTVWAQAVEESNGEQPAPLTLRELTKLVKKRMKERRAEAGIVDAPAKPASANELPPMSRKEYREWREECRVNEERNSHVWDIIRACEALNAPQLPLSEIAVETLEMDGPDVDWVGQAENALRNLEIFVEELHARNKRTPGTWPKPKKRASDAIAATQ